MVASGGAAITLKAAGCGRRHNMRPSRVGDFGSAPRSTAYRPLQFSILYRCCSEVYGSQGANHYIGSTFHACVTGKIRPPSPVLEFTPDIGH